MGLVQKITSMKQGVLPENMEITIKQEIIDDYFDVTCRICARSKSETMISYIDISKSDKLSVMLMKYFSIHITNEDNPLPKSICVKCFKMLSLFHEFILMGKESQKASILKSRFTEKADVEKSIHTENNNNVFESFDFETENDDSDSTLAGYDCDDCWFHCKDENEFKSHQENHKMVNDENIKMTNKFQPQKYICDKCPTEMTDLRKYKRHYRYNHTYDVIKCNHDKCKDLTFQNKAKLRKHNQLKHSVEKPTCYFCNKQYSSKDCLVTHIRNVHQNSRNEKCNICGKCFQTAYNLKVHMRSHTRVAQFSCPECLRPFIYKHLMKQHYEKKHGLDQENWSS
uniref:CSON013096 protein n=1 Tax=Culicoides sonorensis TaxID=179676 RepID=A0A336M796_CULSO